MSMPFPSPYLKSSAYIANVLVDVFKERGIPVLEHTEAIRLHEYRRLSSPSYVFSIFDLLNNPFYLVPYINHTIDKSSSYADSLWTASDLEDAVLGLEQNTSPIILTGTEKLTHGLSAKFAEQQFLAANLLKEKRDGVFVVTGIGSSQNKDSPEDAYNEAVSNFSETQYGVREWITQISEYNNKWNCTIIRPVIIKPMHESLRELSAIMYPKISKQDGDFDAHGTGILYSDIGHSTTTQLPYYSPEPALPDAFKNGIYGPADLRLVIGGYCGVDVTSLFTYYDDSY